MPQTAAPRGWRVLFYSGDDTRAKAEVGRLIDRLGFFGIDDSADHPLAHAMRQPQIQARVSNLIRQPSPDVGRARRAGRYPGCVLLATTRTRHIVDAHVVICARGGRQPIVTSDREDLRRLDPTAVLIAV